MDTSASNCVYWGIFFDNSDFPWHVHEKPTKDKHVTFGYKVPCPMDLVGNEVSVKVIGYGIDDDNEAYEVSIPDELADIYEGAMPAHITLSVSGNGLPVNSRNLPFWELDEPFSLAGTIGYFGFDGEVHLR